ncbi:uncharacterized protein LOC115891523 [Sitophilus oryzae]|uniref:Uncharacterized protein LOC115891523 n=1 Tax=Sitophilus oryzae TaxID=7048 RepID=A0A6J2YXD5_SITOR|nr:uncharacterized protein LOC115891523 [Sitophilus oryzae]
MRMMGLSTLITWVILVIFFVENLAYVVRQDDAEYGLDSSDHISDDGNNHLKVDQPNPELNEDKVKEMSNVLAKLLLLPWPQGASPLLYVEEPHESIDELRQEIFDQAEPNDIVNEQEIRPIAPKRSKYYRKYPWKRQNNRYEPAYMCIPKKDDVFRLLVALHSERNGKRGQLVDFCNRKRPASLVFTNIRFVG